MKKLYFPIYMAIPLLFMTACSSEGDLPEPATQEQAAVQNAVGFSASIAGQANGTRATVVDIKALSSGFGVFAFDQGTQKWATYSQTYVEPNFMKNQLVSSADNGSTWTYTPIKYWPNADGAKLSFFGYAPYQSTLSTTAANEHGLKLVLNEQYGGPAIQYTLPDDLSNTVDLCYADPSGLQDQAKQGVDENIKFQFKHALSRMDFKVQVVNDVVRDDVHSSTATNQALASGTTINIKKVELIGSFAKSGVLALATGNWAADNQANGSIILDNSMFQQVVRNGINGSEAINEISLLKMSMKNDNTGTEYASGDDQTDKGYLTIIPGGKFFLQITYDVVTTDGTNTKNTSTVTNVATTTEALTLEQGKAYEFHLHLGMTSVKLTADVTAWDNSADNDLEIYLPAVVKSATSTLNLGNIPGSTQQSVGN